MKDFKTQTKEDTYPAICSLLEFLENLESCKVLFATFIH